MSEKWSCHECGYQDTETGFLEQGVIPKPGDLCLCLNCGAPSCLDDAGTWQPLSQEDLQRLPQAFKREIARRLRARKLAITEDLAFNQQLKKRE